MAHLQPARRRAGRDSSPNGGPPVPRWVKVSGFAAVVLLLMFLTAILLGGNHGPSRHFNGAVVHVAHQTIPAGWFDSGVRTSGVSP